MKTNLELQKDVQDELLWEPRLDSAEIGVIVKDGIVTLTGFIDSHAKKLAAERAAERVAGVKAVVQQLIVKLENSGRRTDADVAKAALHALKWNSSVPDDKLKIRVEDGWIYLEGELDWQYQKDAAASCVENLIGVVGVTNLISIKPGLSTKVIKNNIKDALHRNAAIEADNIRIETTGNKVILKGNAHSWFERKEIEKAAWCAPGVTNVEDDILVSL